MHVCKVYGRAHISVCYLYALNQTLIFSGTVVTETSVASTMALNSVFTTKMAMCSEVINCFPSRFRSCWSSTVVVAVWSREKVGLLVHVRTHTHTHTHTHTPQLQQYTLMLYLSFRFT